MGGTDPSKNEASMAGKLVTTNNAASLYYAMVSRKHDLAPKTALVLTPGGPAGSFVGSSCYNWGVFSKSKHADVCEDLIRWLEDERNFTEYVSVSVGQAGPVYKRRADRVYWESDPNFDAILHNILRSLAAGYPGTKTPSFVQGQSQHILNDLAR